MEALDDETRREVMKIRKRPSWDGKQVSRPIFQRQWQGFHGYWFKRCGSDTMAKILLTALPQSLRALYTQLHLFLGWTYKEIWNDIMKPMKNVSRRMYRKKWRKSEPPQKKSLEAYELWVLEWTLLAQQAAPVTPLEAKEAFTDALHRHGGYQDEIDELYKYEELKGVELLHQGVHQLIQYELTWRSNHDVAMAADKGETDADLRQMRCRGTGVQREIRVMGHVQHLLIFPKYPQTPACIAAIKDIQPRTAELSRRIWKTERRVRARNSGQGELLMAIGILVAVATIGMVMAIIRMAKRAQKGGMVSRNGGVLTRELPNLALNEVVAGPWKRLQLKHRHALTRACVCHVGSLDIGFLSVRRGFLVRLSTTACRDKRTVEQGGGVAANSPPQLSLNLPLGPLKARGVREKVSLLEYGSCAVLRHPLICTAHFLILEWPRWPLPMTVTHRGLYPLRRGPSPR